MSDEERDEQPASSSLISQRHGGAIRTGGRHPRLDAPTDTDCADAARKVLYAVIPRLKRIATNTPTRDKPNDKRTKLKRRYSTNAQLKAIAELRMIAMMDRTLREGRVTASLFATRDEIIEFFDGNRDQADALMAKIAPHWLGI